jgi:hypothetical protein
LPLTSLITLVLTDLPGYTAAGLPPPLATDLYLSYYWLLSSLRFLSCRWPPSLACNWSLLSILVLTSVLTLSLTSWPRSYLTFSLFLLVLCLTELILGISPSRSESHCLQ